MGVDPTGLFSLAGNLANINIGSSLRSLNQSSITCALNAVKRVLDFIDALQTFQELYKIIDGSPQIATHLRELIGQIGGREELKGTGVFNVYYKVDQAYYNKQ